MEARKIIEALREENIYLEGEVRRLENRINEILVYVRRLIKYVDDQALKEIFKLEEEEEEEEEEELTEVQSKVMSKLFDC